MPWCRKQYFAFDASAMCCVLSGVAQRTHSKKSSSRHPLIHYFRNIIDAFGSKIQSFTYTKTLQSLPMFTVFQDEQQSTTAPTTFMRTTFEWTEMRGHNFVCTLFLCWNFMSREYQKCIINIQQFMNFPKTSPTVLWNVSYVSMIFWKFNFASEWLIFPGEVNFSCFVSFSFLIQVIRQTKY